MARAKYRIHRITIEGFRGFTDQQTIDLGGRNAFIFGVNGRGKSSLIEAVRWALFGSPGGGDIEVRNTFYAKGECSVSVDLVGEGGSLRVTRELRPGAPRSRQFITDAAGKALLEREALPQLARIGHQEGTQVIFAAQHGAGRQATVDISDFTKVLCFYLRLDLVPDLVAKLRDLVEERKAKSEELAGDIEHVEARYRGELESVRNRLAELLKNAPWRDAAPTESETEAKVRRTADSFGVMYGTGVPSTGPIKDVLLRLKQWNDGFGATGAKELVGRIEALQAKWKRAAGHFSTLTEARSTAADLEGQVATTREERTRLLGSRDLEHLRQELVDLEGAKSEKAMRLDIAQRAKALAARATMHQCPVCRAATSEALDVSLDTCIEENSLAEAEVKRLRELREMIEQVDLLDESLAELERTLAGGHEAASNSRRELESILGHVDADIDVQDRIAALDRAIDELNREIHDANAERERRTQVIRDLDTEVRFHDYRAQVSANEFQLGTGLAEPRDVLRQHRELLDTVVTIHALLEEHFDQAINRAVPELNKMMTDVYRRITRQQSYDEVRIVSVPDQPGRRELRVGSKHSPKLTFPPNVLNGQAAKALQLVPYFVFSRFQPEIMELDMLLVDDPSESFDTSHVRDLVWELSEAASHAQLFVATHEQEKFDHLLGEFFAKDSLAKIVVTAFDPLKGPTLAVE